MNINLYFYGLPKISLNEWYSGVHWKKRKSIKDTYKLLIRNQYKHVWSKKSVYHVTYEFGFKSRPLDTTNTVAMLKMIEDIIFEDDSYKIIPKITMSSVKSKEDYVKIDIEIK